MCLKRYATVYATAVCAIILCGCPPTRTARVDQRARIASDVRKAELLRQLDKKWENPMAHFELGQVYHAEGDWADAERHYNYALGFDPAYRDAQAAIVKLQLDKGDKSKAEWAANTYITQVASFPEQLLALGVAFEKQGLYDYALRCYNDALKSAPDSYSVSRQLGYYYLNRNQKELAKDYLIRSFELNPNQPDVAGELGRLGVTVRIPEAAGSENLGQPAKPPAPQK
jgi:tetratricopeptide (TPR) repeat protein